ncbi:hypothetical protein FEM41_14925 [Jejubacter calystegiae]|uniref:Uncharacterized protein n=1 Tax=Jejubacter calystegiae TaxID=2579935 RepID=A0A4P8YLF0_9ENTR|nr:hypothetical protein [Jejubacter calystegiae]QCT20846.1 hypothetical protein FEM41_14925 [Jejubacter calystegiae]
MDKETRKQIEQDLDNELTKMLSVVTVDKFHSFLTDRGLIRGLTCRMCGSDDIGVPLMSFLGGTPFLNYSKVDGGGPPHSLYNYEYRLPCNNCGFVHSFAVYPVLKWIEEQEGNGAKSDR